MSEYVLGIDIGGTKCAVVLAERSNRDKPQKLIKDKRTFETKQARGWRAVLGDIFAACEGLLEANALKSSDLYSIGISCGGPLDSVAGIIYSPPNLPDWDGVPLVDLLEDRFGVKTFLQNDANACALAEWRFGAGKGYSNLIFLTFGTGMGAGLILDGKLYSGTNDMAGEVGHIRLAEDGPMGYGKAGSFEGFCSGGGIARLGQTLAQENIKKGTPPAYCKTLDDLEKVTAKSIADHAKNGDPLALKVYEICGEYLGRGLSVLIDILNPQAIIIGSIYERSGQLLAHSMNKALKAEALPFSLSVCEVLPAALGDSIGDYAALGVALNE
ncbi:MAG: ROK family protein [Clostridiales bacterium]|nr:ROK family protein [Clostridiales bacterium]